jgi:murein DD-endopeptidase MepM/ murein hydrolase activator NlpD
MVHLGKSLLMGRKEKFIYNIHTLTYEKVVIPFKTRIWQVFGFFSAVLVSATLLLALFYSYIPSPREKLLLGDIEKMKYKYAELNGQLESMSKVLNNVKDREAGVHRAIFGMNPTDDDVWNAGVGGHDAHPELENIIYGRDVVRETLEKMDRLAYQLSLESRALDTIQNLANNQQAMLASVPSIKPVREDKLQKSMNILSGFGYRVHPIYKVRKFHAGVDFPARIGTAIQASGDGVVSEAGWHSGYGNCVRVSHGYGYETWYAHMSRMTVHVGEKVKKGQKIGEVGDTGVSTAPHLHYEVHYKGAPINPIHFCMDNLTPEEYQILVNAANAASQSLD